MNTPIMEFRCGHHAVQMYRTSTGAYSISVKNYGRTCSDRPSTLDQTFEVAEVVDKDLAIHCFNHTVAQYQKEAL